MALIPYVTSADIKLLTGIADTDVSNSDWNSIIDYATATFNSDVNIKVIRERINYIDPTRQNKVDGSNTTFYVRDWKNWYIGDRNDSGSVTSGDVLLYSVASDGTETAVNISSVTHDEGKFVAASAPASGSRAYVTYSKSPIDESTPNNLVKTAVSYIAGALAFTKMDVKKLKSFSIGKIRVADQSQAFKEIQEEYRKIIDRIRTRALKRYDSEPITERRI